MIDDLGSGALADDPVYRGEPDVRTSIGAGVDVACFSGDKLLGGPQAGVLVGTQEAIRRCTAHPLMRALRPDKLTVAALEATLALHRDPAAARMRIPAVRMLATPPDELRRRAEALAAEVGGEVVPTVGRVGGGSLPLAEIASYAVALPAPEGDDATAAALRALDPPVVARVSDGRVLLDVLTMSPGELAELGLMLGRP